MDDLTIRQARPEDAATIYALVCALSEKLGVADKLACEAKDFEQVGVGDRPPFEALIAERAGEAIGLCLYFDSFSSLRGRSGVYVQDLYVAEAARGLGLGQRLLAEVAAITHERGGAYLRLSVDMQNVDARNFYEKTGLTAASEEQIRKIDGQAFIDLGRKVFGISA